MRRVLFFSLFAAFWTVSVTSCDKDDDFDAEILEGIDEQGSIVGKFSVSPNLQVQFSRGNLQYQASTNTWKFADHQYDVVGNGNNKRSETYNGWIDLFFRGTSGNDNLLPPYASSCYYDADSVFWYTDYGEPSNWYFIKCDISKTKWDWGSNAISNGGNRPNKWWTLNSTQWEYLIHRRDNADKLLGVANVNKRYGLVILPDNWERPEEVNFDAISDSKKIKFETYNDIGNSGYSGEFPINKYSKLEWAKMQQNGAVFLPMAGFANYFTTDANSAGYYYENSDINIDGWYMVSDYYPFIAYSPTCYVMSFSSYRIVIDGWGQEYAVPVRLVKDAE